MDAQHNTTQHNRRWITTDAQHNILNCVFTSHHLPCFHFASFPLGTHPQVQVDTANQSINQSLHECIMVIPTDDCVAVQKLCGCQKTSKSSTNNPPVRPSVCLSLCHSWIGSDGTRRRAKPGSTRIGRISFALKNSQIGLDNRAFCVLGAQTIVERVF